MSFRVTFARAADEDYDHAIDWYLAEAPHEVERFMVKFDAAVDVIREQPLLPRTLHRELRSVKTSVFPYHLWYRVLEDIEMVEVVAVLHASQDGTTLDRR